jgi:hypothetical protein
MKNVKPSYHTKVIKENTKATKIVAFEIIILRGII